MSCVVILQCCLILPAASAATEASASRCHLGAPHT
uniref:Uncharacterized protein n=1 Tax=Anguilla anguilla TaxID=7936 RepID=A0A0E9Q216_ANGAN